jgi:hypothetical protein
MRTLPDKITVNVTVEDIENAGPYNDGQVCLLATALKRQLGDENDELDIQVGGITVAILKQRYFIKDPFDDSIAYKAKLTKKPFTIELVKMTEEELLKY